MNRLSTSTSPYLRQHAANPVDWYQWGPEAFTAARDLDRPILLSVGYSACHWCHVMAHESFEDPDVAAVMNRLFVNIKVDREERPDVDAIYMMAVQLTTGHGGWPMTVFLTPDGKPVYAGTYFPKADRGGHPGFVRVMEAVAHAWETERATLVSQSDRVADAIERTMRVDEPKPGALAPERLDDAVEQMLSQVDQRFGGFGGAPKFPQAMSIDFLLRAYVRRRDERVLDAVRLSLDAMAAGGMYDQVGGGFHRYSVDAHWLVPHFEKMLYDQALLAGAYLHAWMVTSEPRYRRIAEETITYVLRDLRHPRGGFFCAEDADSEGVEGKFYLWQHDEIVDVAGTDAAAVIRYFGVTRDGNFVDPHTDYRGNILNVVDRTQERPEAVAHALPRLYATRTGRVRPGLDDKVLVAWNALFCRTLAEAAAAFGRQDWMDAARTNARFLFNELRRADGRLLRIWPGDTPVEGAEAPLACAEDYAALAGALVTLAELDDVAWLDAARAVADDLIRLFADEEAGGFYSTGSDAEALIVRPKDTQDNATPSENSLACEMLLRLAVLTGASSYEETARRWLERMAPLLVEHPTAFAYTLGAVERAVFAPVEIAICGEPDDPATVALRAEVHTRLIPGGVVLGAAPGTGADRSPLLADRDLVDGRPAAYVCERYACRRPVTEPGALRAEIDAALARE